MKPREDWTDNAVSATRRGVVLLFAYDEWRAIVLWNMWQDAIVGKKIEQPLAPVIDIATRRRYRVESVRCRHCGRRWVATFPHHTSAAAIRCFCGKTETERVDASAR